MVKKLSIAVMAIFMMASLAACGNSGSGTQTQDTAAQTQVDTENSATEIVEVTEALETEKAGTEAAKTEEAATEEAESGAAEFEIAATEAAGTEAAEENAETGITEASVENAEMDTTEVTTDMASEETAEAAEAAVTDGGSDGIVVYFSWSGNTRTIAEEIQRQTGADIFELTPVTPYSTDYDTVLDEAQAEQSENARPEISGAIEKFEQYDVVYLGYPNWWGDMPMIIYSFLDNYDLSGKTIVPFVSSGGSGFSGSLTTIAEMEPEATLTEGLSLSSSASAEPADAVMEWLSSLTIE